MASDAWFSEDNYEMEKTSKENNWNLLLIKFSKRVLELQEKFDAEQNFLTTCISFQQKLYKNSCWSLQLFQWVI